MKDLKIRCSAIGKIMTSPRSKSDDDDGNTATEAIKTQKPSISDERFNGAVQSIIRGDYSIEQLKSQFAMTNEQLNYLNTEL